MLRAIRALIASKKSFRWSLYFVHKDDGLRYALHENSVTQLVGYVLAQIETGLHVSSNWKLHLNFNWKHQALELDEKYFPSGKPSNELWTKIASIDPGWQVRGNKPVFVDVRTNKALSLGWGYEAASQTDHDRLASIQQLFDKSENGLKNSKPTLASVLAVVFQK